jgi:hypothetical protein
MTLAADDKTSYYVIDIITGVAGLLRSSGAPSNYFQGLKDIYRVFCNADLSYRYHLTIIYYSVESV